MMGLTIGEMAPAFSLPATGQRTISSDGLKGQKAVLYFYPKDDTSGCTVEAIDFQRLYPEFRAAGIEVIGISPDGLRSHDRFCGKHGLEFSLASDEEKSTLQAFGVWVEKSMYGRKYMGVERTTVLLDVEGRVARIWPKVKVSGHAEEVLAAAKAL
jgi:peroxiredoxin Q/BCP